MLSITSLTIRKLAAITAPFLLLPALVVHAGEKGVVDVRIEKFKFIPQEVTVNVGESVRWTNSEKRQYHSVWFEQAGDPEPPYLFPGDVTERAFGQPGTYPYRCGPHPEMTGVVHVE